VVLAVRDDDEWSVAADWKAESTLNAVYADGGYIIGWMPYAVPEPILAGAAAVVELKTRAPMSKKIKLLLAAFVKAENVSPDMLRITHEEAGWCVSSGNTLLMRPSGSTHFDTPQQAFRVLAGAASAAR